ncbi:MAG: hypothetical protein J5960_05815 [Desulfovibrio sp.]|nr:hypothetical protein [Desulfovibrio sp.]
MLTADIPPRQQGKTRRETALPQKLVPFFAGTFEGAFSANAGKRLCYGEELYATY